MRLSLRFLSLGLLVWLAGCSSPVSQIDAIASSAGPRAVSPGNTSYYVDGTNGDDNNAGTTSSAPWKSIAKANTMDFKSGDKLLFKGGQTISGTLQLNTGDVGTDSARIEVGSYGTGSATLSNSSANVVEINGTQGVTITNLYITGPGPSAAANTAGIKINGGARFVKVEWVDISGFKDAGIVLDKVQDVAIENSKITNNGYAGISTTAAWPPTSNDLSYRVTIRNCKVINNPGYDRGNVSGYGIVLSGINTGTVEYNEIGNNGASATYANAGPTNLSITGNSSYIIVQFNAIHNAKTAPSGLHDGGGIDVAAGAANCTFQYNYIYDNDAYAFLLDQYGGSQYNPYKGHVIRYNVMENNNKRHNEGTIEMINESDASGYADMYIYNNTIYSPNKPAILFSEQSQYNGAVANVQILNNILVTANGQNIVRNMKTGISLRGNSYYRTDGAFVVDGYSDLASWANAKGQEKVNGTIVGISGNPLVANLGGGEDIIDATSLTSLTAYKLQNASPCLNKGQNVNNLLGINIGNRDYWGSSLPQGTSYEIGAYEGTGVAGSGGGGVSNKTLYKWNGSSWASFGGTGTRVTVDSNNRPWLVNAAGEVWQYDGASWQKRINSGAQDIGAGGNGVVVAIGADIDSFGGNMLKWNGTSWDNLGGKAKKVDIASDGGIWVLNGSGEVWQWNSDGSWTLRRNGVQDLGCGYDGTNAAVDNDTNSFGGPMFKWNGSSWISMGGNAKMVDVDNSGTLWVVNSTGEIWSSNTDGSWTKRNSGGALDIGCGPTSQFTLQ